MYSNNLEKNMTLIFLFLNAIIIVSCTEKDNQQIVDQEIVGTEKTSNSAMLTLGPGCTDPYLSGTFVDFWNKSTWSQTQWNDYMDEMLLVGVETVIVQFTAYNQYVWCNSSNSYSTEAYANALPRLLTAASNTGIEVYVGLYFNDEFWSNTTNTSILNTHANRSKELATEIWNQYGSYSSFAGWYISHEPAPYYYDTTLKFNIFKNNLVNAVSNHCDSISNKPVAIAAFFNESLSSSNDLLYFMNRLGGCNLDVIMLQDGTGASENGTTPHCAIGNVATYFNDAKWGLYGESPVFGGDFWSDTETFKPDGSPETFTKVEQKLNIVDAYVTKIVTFQYFLDMGIDSPHTGSNQIAADSLRSQYRTYYAN